jgi:hypothetical protein
VIVLAPRRRPARWFESQACPSSTKSKPRCAKKRGVLACDHRAQQGRIDALEVDPGLVDADAVSGDRAADRARHHEGRQGRRDEAVEENARERCRDEGEQHPRAPAKHAAHHAAVSWRPSSRVR